MKNLIPKFCFRQKVRVTAGFYRGQKGRITSYQGDLYGINFSKWYSTYERFEYFREEDLEKA